MYSATGNSSLDWNDEVFRSVDNRVKPASVQIYWKGFYSFHTISISCFLPSFQLPCDTIGVLEYMKKQHC